ncbi:MAG: peptidoglycan editing factor PgeF [Thermodesulfobacteriota bacterium]|nr:peptidoglycan editing factor PgeF [Thermodesulfobacteriota bacterium]
MFQISQKGTIKYLESKVLKEYDFVTHAFCTRRGGVSEGKFANLNFSLREGDGKEIVSRNWEILAASFNLSVEQFFVANQVHSDGILVIDNEGLDIASDRSCDFDAIISDKPGLAIGILTADCVPIFLVDRKKRVIGVVHAGWKGTSLKIAAKTIDTFVRRFSSSTADIIAVIGPAIGHCCYQVNGVVFEAMKEDGNRKSFFSKCDENGKWMLDLPLANKLQIQNAGVSPENISLAGVCTSCHVDDFFSHRREMGRTGRQLSFIVLK